jgi:hypothetical protein
VDSLTAMQRVSPATWRVYAAALLHRHETGAWPSANMVLQLAHSEGADREAALVLTRYELPAHDDPATLVPLGEPRGLHGEARVSSTEALFALVARGQPILVHLRLESGRTLSRHADQLWACALARS